MQLTNCSSGGDKKLELNMLNKDIIYKSQLNLNQGDKYVLR